MILYVQDENYHFDGYLSGVIIDDNRVALFNKTGIEEHNISITREDLKWYELDSFEMIGNTVKIKAKNYAFYREFFCLNILTLT